MPQPVISVRGLGKKYRLGATLTHDTLRDRIAHGCGDAWRRLARRGTSDQSSVTSDQSAVGPKSLGTTELLQTPRSETAIHDFRFTSSPRRAALQARRVELAGFAEVI